MAGKSDGIEPLPHIPTCATADSQRFGPQATGTETATRFQAAIRGRQARRAVGQKRHDLNVRQAAEAAQRAAQVEAERAADKAYREKMVAEGIEKKRAAKQRADYLQQRWEAEMTRCATVACASTLFVVVLGVCSVSALIMSPVGRCMSTGRRPLPVACAGGSDSGSSLAALQNVVSNHWRQPIQCCDGQVLTLPVPRGAEYHDLVRRGISTREPSQSASRRRASVEPQPYPS